MQIGYKEVFRSIKWSEESSHDELSFETPACQDTSVGAEELNWVESSELAAAK
jgi:hypothetical protein